MILKERSEPAELIALRYLNEFNGKRKNFIIKTLKEATKETSQKIDTLLMTSSSTCPKLDRVLITFPNSLSNLSVSHSCSDNPSQLQTRFAGTITSSHPDSFVPLAPDLQTNRHRLIQH